MGTSLHPLRRIARAAGSSLCALSLLLGAVTAADAQIINTVAGTADIGGRPARSISVHASGIAMAPNGSVYVADPTHAQVLRFDPVAQTFIVVAGTAVAGYDGDSGPATMAQLSYPSAIAVDTDGNLFIADMGNDRIRKITAASGEISTVAGGGWSSADGALATDATLQGPASVALGADGSLYIVEQAANRIRRVAADTGMIFTIAGTGSWGSNGNDGPATLAELSRPSDVTVDASGNIYIADEFNHSIRVIEATTGIIRRFAGTGQSNWNAADVVDGLPALETAVSFPKALRFDALGNLVFTEHETGLVRKIDAVTGIVSRVAGGGAEFEGVPAASGRIGRPQGLALASNGDIYVSAFTAYMLQRISAATGMLEVVAGNALPHYSGDGGSALLAQISPLVSVVNANNDLLFVDNALIRKVDHGSGNISIYAGAGEPGIGGDGGPAINASLAYPSALASDASGNLYLGDRGYYVIRKIDAATGIIQHYAGIGFGYSGDGGPAINAQMMTIHDLAIDPTGNLYLIEEGSPRVRKINSATGIITTVAGNGSYNGPLGDGQLATNVALYTLDAIAVDAQANIFVVHQNRVRRIDAITGIITTVAGTGAYSETGDGGPALSAGIRATDLTLDAAGNIFITSLYTHRVRKIDKASGIISTVTGQGVAGYAGDGGNATAALLNGPRDLAFDAQGNLYVSETYHVRRVAGVGAPPIPADTTAPIISFNAVGTQGNNGWYVSNVTVNWTVSDPESSITSSSGCTTTSITTDTSGLNLICTATSTGGTASRTVTIKRDVTTPSLTFGATSPSPNASGWNKSNVSIAYTTSDASSGVASASIPSPIVLDTDGANMTRSVIVTDRAGNARTFTTTTIFLDKTVPTIAVTAPVSGAAYVQGTSVIASYSCSDTLSSVTGCIGTVLQGSAIDTATPGSKTFSITATDRAGNAKTTSYPYTVTPASTPTYCSSRGNSTSYEWIRSIQIGSFVNTSNNNGGFGNFTTNPIAIARGNNSLVLTPGFSSGSYLENWRVWVDLNQDGVFSANEALYTASGQGALTGGVSIPNTALPGTTRMRISMSFGSMPNPCGNFSYGEVEDYRVSIAP